MPPEKQAVLVAEEPRATGDERWDALLAALTEHLNAKLDLAPPEWAEPRVLEKPWSRLRSISAQASSSFRPENRSPAV